MDSDFVMFLTVVGAQFVSAVASEIGSDACW